MNYINEIEINIVDDIIIYKDALAPRLGVEVNSFLINTLNLNNKPLLLHLNIMDTNPIDYLFSKNAFGNTFKIISKDEKIDIIYYVQTENQKWNLLKGILQFVNPNYLHSESIEEECQLENMNLKICNNSGIIFIGKLSNYEEKILLEINSKREINTYDIVELFKSEMEIHKITSTIESLKQKKFIYSDGDKASEILMSVNNKIKSYV